jgi:hypothetical protein
MAVHRHQPVLLAGALALAVLAACGGGGGGDGTGLTSLTGGTDSNGSTGSTTSAAVVDKYVGTWVLCRPTGSMGSEREDLTLVKASDTMVDFSSTNTAFATTDCSGAQTGSQTDSGTATFVGSEALGTDTVDKIDIVQNGTPSKQVVVIRADGKFYSGVDVSSGGPVDANGYPTTLEADGSTKA